MPDELLASSELAAPVPTDLTATQRIALWIDLVDACEQLLLAGLRHKVGPNGDVAAAYRQWYAERMEEHDQMLIRMMEEFQRRSGGDAH